MKAITKQEIDTLLNAKRSVTSYPRKGFVSVDGFKRYKASKAVLSYLQKKRSKSE